MRPDAGSGKQTTDIAMRSNLFSGLVYLGTILLSFGIVIFIIELFASRFGTPHAIGWTLAIGLLIAGGVATAAGVFGSKSARGSAPR